MPEVLFPWRRYWYKRGAEPTLDDGFLPDPEASWAKFAKLELMHSTSTQSERCVVFLGEPSMGKSRTVGVEGLDRSELDALIRKEGSYSAWIDLREVDSRNSLREELSSNSAVQAWTTAKSGFLYLFLDSLDECQLELSNVTPVLISTLKEYPVERLMLRIVCRSAEWPPFLESELQKVFKQELLVVELAPLRWRDVETAALSSGIDPKKLKQSITKLNAHPFARKPSTLKFLIRILSKGGELPDNQWDLYEQGCLVWCTEYNESRISSGHDPSFTPKQLLSVVSRIAALSIITNRLNIARHQGLDGGPDSLAVEKIVGERESVDGMEFEVTKTCVMEALSTAFFVSAAPKYLKWETRGIAEFLTARYFLSRKLNIQKVLSFLIHPLDPEGKLVPQLHQVAAWLSERNDEVFRYIAVREVDLLLSLDPATLNDTRKRIIVEGLLASASRSALHLKFGTKALYQNLAYAGIEDLLRPIVVSNDESIEARIVAVELTLACELRRLSGEMLRMALDPMTPARIRVLAALGVSDLGSDNEKGELRVLLHNGTVDSWPDDELRGAVLSALWPEHMDFKQLVSFKKPPKRPNTTGLYTQFIRDEIPGKLKRSELANALDWVGQFSHISHLWDPDRDCVTKLLALGLEQLSSPDILDRVSSIVQRRLKSHEELFPYFSAGDQMVLESPNRRGLVESIIKGFEHPDRDWVYLLSHPNRLLKREDFQWLIDLGLDSKNSNVRSCCARLIPHFASNSRSDVELVYTAAEKWPELKQNSLTILGPIDITSRLAEDLRAIYEAETRHEKIKPDKTQKALSEISEVLRLDKPDAWQVVSYLLVSTGESQSAVPHQTPAWKELGPSKRDICIDIAKRYVLEGDPQTSTWFETNSWPYSAVAGFYGLLLLMQFDPDWVKALDTQVLGRWTSILLTFFREGDPKHLDDLVGLAYKANPSSFLKLFKSRLGTEGRQSSYLSVLKNVESVWDKQIADTLFDAIIKDDFPNTGFDTSLRVLLAHKHQEARQFAEGLLTKYAETGANGERAKKISEVLLTIEPRSAWDILWPIFQVNNAFGREVIEAAAYYSFGNIPLLDVLSAPELGQLFKWMLSQYPFREEPDRGGAVSPRFTAERLRDGALQKLSRFGTFDSAEVLKQLQTEFPEIPWQYHIAQSNAQARERTWVPPTPEKFLEAVVRFDSRYVVNEAQFVEVLFEALASIQQRLHAETPAVEELWNSSLGRTKLYSPKDENELSNWLKRRLEDEIVARNVVIGREVQIRRLVTNAGEQVDLKLVAVSKDSKQPLVVIMEVKGCWNSELKTSMKEQLANRYLKENFYHTGIYLIGWFVCDAWDRSDPRKKKAKFSTLEQTKAFFEDQAQQLSSAALNIRSFVLDAARR